MTTRLPLLLAASWLVLPGVARAQEGAELTPEKVAQIRRDESQALAKVNEEFGNRQPSELSSEERAQAIDKQQAAAAAVLEKHGVSAKEYARYEARMRPEDNARAEAEKKRLEELAQAAKQPQDTGEKSAEDVHVQLGISDKEPVELEVAEGAEPVVDVGVPGDEATADLPVDVGALQQELDEKPEKRPAARASSSGAKKKRVVKRRRASGDD
ncbi:hypothetical protein [Myxococcus sp. RHSTA-1-4]|uniref:hypothetical protein n=1 Tax=Myxococcus sp. RHSTA-1-4 TaxID=2874601 RepID=UPI001CBD4B97|nr:hypothetical protein [Myxococcus sp. RHSTA-1-4]